MAGRRLFKRLKTGSWEYLAMAGRVGCAAFGGGPWRSSGDRQHKKEKKLHVCATSWPASTKNTFPYPEKSSLARARLGPAVQCFSELMSPCGIYAGQVQAVAYIAE